MGRRLATLISALLTLNACAASAATVSIERSDRIRNASVLEDPGDTTASDTTDEGGPGSEQDPSPSTTVPGQPVATDTNVIDFGPNKAPRSYDDFLLAALADIDDWLGDEFPVAFGQPWTPLEGKVYAGYPNRADDLPGCGEPRTSYDELQLFVAFYCPTGDFIIYDDGDVPIRLADGEELEPILFSLAEEYGPATIGIVLAHEYGHAVQARTGALDRNLPTVTTEQQADCIAGAWAGRASAGLAPGVPFDDADVRAGLISMITVQDPVGTDPNSAGGHGSGFDRVGAFQVGFQSGLSRCAELIDDPLPLTPLRFTQSDFQTGGNADFGFTAPSDLFVFLVDDLNLLYDEDLDVAFPNFTPLTLTPVQRESEATCDDPVGDFTQGVVLCVASSTVYLNESEARALYDDFGDFGPAYLLGLAWAEAAQISANSGLTGEERQLRNDCLTGNWVRTDIPVLDDNGDFVVVTDEQSPNGRILLPQPRHPDRTASISPNDLTEAIQTAISIGDESDDDDLVGSAFEKIDAFRRGTLDGLSACT